MREQPYEKILPTFLGHIVKILLRSQLIKELLLTYKKTTLKLK